MMGLQFAHLRLGACYVVFDAIYSCTHMTSALTGHETILLIYCRPPQWSVWMSRLLY